MAEDGWDRRGKFLFTEALKELGTVPDGPIVEVGIIRDMRVVARQADGWATLAWLGIGRSIHCVDTDPKAIQTTGDLIYDKIGSERVKLHLREGVDFLQELDEQIALLYLDGPDADKGGQEAHLEMFRACRGQPYLILIDDCDPWPGRWEGRGKGHLVLPEALATGYTLIADNRRQVLLRLDVAKVTEMTPDEDWSEPIVLEDPTL
jgi:hypothetical protein